MTLKAPMHLVEQAEAERAMSDESRGLMQHLCEAHVCAHAFATAIHIPHLDLAVQAS